MCRVPARAIWTVPEAGREGSLISAVLGETAQLFVLLRGFWRSRVLLCRVKPGDGEKTSASFVRPKINMSPGRASSHRGFSFVGHVIERRHGARALFSPHRRIVPRDRRRRRALEKIEGLKVVKPLARSIKLLFSHSKL
jgi:hypothetical protein